MSVPARHILNYIIEILPCGVWSKGFNIKGRLQQAYYRSIYSSILPLIGTCSRNFRRRVKKRMITDQPVHGENFFQTPVGSIKPAYRINMCKLRSLCKQQRFQYFLPTLQSLFYYCPMFPNCAWQDELTIQLFNIKYMKLQQIKN